MLGNLIAILEKGAAHAEAKNFDASILVNSRLRTGGIYQIVGYIYDSF